MLIITVYSTGMAPAEWNKLQANLITVISTDNIRTHPISAYSAITE